MRRNFLLLRGLLLALSLWSTLPASAAPISRDDPESTDPGHKGISTAIDALVTAQAVLTVVEPRDPAWQVAVFFCIGIPNNASFQCWMAVKWPPNAAVPGTCSTPRGILLASGHQPSLWLLRLHSPGPAFWRGSQP